MKKEELYQLRNLKHEIEMLEEEQKYLQNELKTPISDSVSASSAEFPYTLHSVSIHGVSEKAIAKSKRIKKKIRLRRIRCIDEYDRLNDFIDSVPDSEMRQILTFYYINCLTWQQVARKIGETDESYPRRKCDQFLKAAENAEK